MKTIALSLGKLLVFWLLFFLAQRLLFILHFAGDFQGSYGELLIMPFHGLRLDLSAFGYLNGLALLLSLPGFFIKTDRGMRILNGILSVYFWVIIVLVSIMMSAEIVTYIEWKTKLSSKIFIHFETPDEIFRTGSGEYTIWYFLYFIIQLVIAWVIWKWVIRKNKLRPFFTTWLKQSLYAISYLVIFAGLFVLMIRGGWQQIPVTTTDAYHSEKQIVNDVSVNPVWNFIHTCYVYFKVDLSEYYKNLDPKTADQIVEDLYASDGIDTVQIFTNPRPNIILVTLEGWSGQMIEPLGGEPGVTPHFNGLCKEGLLFTEMYATGGTSETGHSSIISGYPTIAGISISTESAKCRQLPSINQTLEDLGYSSFYTFGGSLSYGNIGGYLTDVGFDRIVDENDLDLKPSGKLGIHDEAMFPYFLSEIQTAKLPYFYGLFTQSTHAPYDMPAEPFGDYNDPYTTSMHYADEHLGKFVEGIRQLPDFENTIVLFIADHGRANIYNQDTYSEKYFHIPFLIWGGALKSEFMGTTIDKVGAQSDVAKTLLRQMNLDTNPFHWSKDLLDPSTKDWAICTSTLSYGLKNRDGYTVYHMIDDRLVHSAYSDEDKTALILKKCRAVLESMYREFVEL
ncbi:MAG: LTA synthase family protein [Crocinitomicaceae bacterium]